VTASEPLGVPGGAQLVTATSTKSAGVCSANVSGIDTTVQVARDLTVAVGDVLLVHRVGSIWVASCRLGTAAPADQPADQDSPDPNPSTYTGTLTVLPTSTGTYRDAAWVASTDDVIQGQRGGWGNATGAAFYGTKPTSLAGATVTAARLTGLVRTGGPFASTGSTLWLVTENGRPVGAPTLTSSTAGPALVINRPPDDFTVPTAWAQAMVDGTAGGLALSDADGSPWLQFAGRATLPSAFTLVIDWSRTP
jgi:hypothetical protein